MEQPQDQGIPVVAPLTIMPVVVGRVLELEGVSGKDKLKQLKVDIGAGGEPLQIVTSAPNIVVDSLCVVATVGATVSLGGEDVEVKEAVVGGVKSTGMLCDAPMLGWQGGGAGNAALVPTSFAPGDAPPDKRPRMDGDSDAKKTAEVEVVMSAKDKRKAEAAAKKAAREAAKAAKAAEEAVGTSDKDN